MVLRAGHGRKMAVELNRLAGEAAALSTAADATTAVDLPGGFSQVSHKSARQ
jgi:hypothetical protein